MNGLFIEKTFYHIYPLGMADCPKRNDFNCPAGIVFETLTQDLDRLVNMGISALYIGPIFESTAHGYDTLDYFYVDRRLGNNEKFKSFTNECHKRGISVVLDAVFNHTGRDFFAFKDLIQHGANSEYKDWYLNVNFNSRSCFGDCFDYDGWAGCKDLVKLNVDNPKVRDYLFSAVDMWMSEFQIDGLRLDAADVLSKSFMDSLSSFCKSKNPNFWLMGEVVHGDYNQWVRPGRLDSVTNYQIYKSLWSALNDKNMHELAYNLNREFGVNNQGIYKNMVLYNFLDNHDVNRIASVVNNCRHLYTLYGILFTIPGIPSIYYHSEYGIRGVRGDYDDYQLRPVVPPFINDYYPENHPTIDSESLVSEIKRFAEIRKNNQALQTGDYKELLVTSEQIAFMRMNAEQTILVCVNASQEDRVLYMNNVPSGWYVDLLSGEKFHSNDLKGIKVSGTWLRILRFEQ